MVLSCLPRYCGLDGRQVSNCIDRKVVYSLTILHQVLVVMFSSKRFLVASDTQPELYRETVEMPFLLGILAMSILWARHQRLQHLPDGQGTALRQLRMPS